MGMRLIKKAIACCVVLCASVEVMAQEVSVSDELLDLLRDDSRPDREVIQELAKAAPERLRGLVPLLDSEPLEVRGRIVHALARNAGKPGIPVYLDRMDPRLYLSLGRWGSVCITDPEALKASIRKSLDEADASPCLHNLGGDVSIYSFLEPEDFEYLQGLLETWEERERKESMEARESKRSRPPRWWPAIRDCRESLARNGQYKALRYYADRLTGEDREAQYSALVTCQVWIRRPELIPFILPFLDRLDGDDYPPSHYRGGGCEPYSEVAAEILGRFCYGEDWSFAKVRHAWALETLKQKPRMMDEAAYEAGRREYKAFSRAEFEKLRTWWQTHAIEYQTLEQLRAKQETAKQETEEGKAAKRKSP